MTESERSKELSICHLYTIQEIHLTTANNTETVRSASLVFFNPLLPMCIKADE